MENNLDKYFKDNLHGRKFEMKEEFWLGAEKLLEAQERRRKRRGIFWWFGGGLAVLSLVALGWWFLGENGIANQAVVPSKIAEQTQTPNSEASPVFDEKNGEKSSAQSNKTEEIEGAATLFLEGKNNQAKVKTQTQHTNSPTRQQPIDNQQDVNKSTRSLFSNKSSSNRQAAPPTVGKNGSKSSESAFLPEAENSARSADNIAQQPPSNAQPQVEILPQPTAETERFERVKAPDWLALPTAHVTGDFEPKDLAAKAKIEVARPRKLHLGVMASQLLNARPDSGEQARIGLRAGLVLRYDLNSAWYLASGIQYQRRCGHFEASKTATTRSYRFGLELDTLLLRPNSLHYLSVPVLLGWANGHHQFEGGLLLDYLTGVHGETGSYLRSGEPPMKVFSSAKSGWMTEDGYRRFTPTAQLGYRYRVNGHWSLGLSANYTLGGILDKNYEPPVGGFLLKEADKFHLGLQAVYIIK